MKYQVNNIYPCIQGEGVLTGVPMVLLRLNGCAVGCPWCDTKETWYNQAEHKRDDILDCLGTNPLWCEMSGDEIASYIHSTYPNFEWVLLTGGEPAQQQLAPLVSALKSHRFKVALETSGTATGHLDCDIDWVCVSPKFNMPGGKPVLSKVLNQADEIKQVVGKQADIDKLEEVITDIGYHGHVCLQPISQSRKATELCVKTVQEKNWRLSVQLHKYLNLP